MGVPSTIARTMTDDRRTRVVTERRAVVAILYQGIAAHGLRGRFDCSCAAPGAGLKPLR